MIANSKPVTKIDALIQAGLGSNLSKLPYYRETMIDPRAGFYNMVYRDYAVEIYNALLNYCLNDNTLYNRLRQLVLADNTHITQRAFESLMDKSTKHDIPLETLIEVYNRGYRNNTTKHLTNEQFAFNRVNSYIAKGEAYRTDSDLNENNVTAIKTIQKVARGKRHG